MAILEIRNVSKFFGGLAANSDVSFDVEQGKILGLIGPNGAGKTTLFNCITGYYPPSKGDVLFKGVAAERAPAGPGLPARDGRAPGRRSGRSRR